MFRKKIRVDGTVKGNPLNLIKEVKTEQLKSQAGTKLKLGDRTERITKNDPWDGKG